MRAANLGLRFLLFGAATAGWFAAGLPALGIVFAGLVVVNLLVLFAWGQRDY